MTPFNLEFDKLYENIEKLAYKNANPGRNTLNNYFNKVETCYNSIDDFKNQFKNINIFDKKIIDEKFDEKKIDENLNVEKIDKDLNNEKINEFKKSDEKINNQNLEYKNNNKNLEYKNNNKNLEDKNNGSKNLIDFSKFLKNDSKKVEKKTTFTS